MTYETYKKQNKWLTIGTNIVLHKSIKTCKISNVTIYWHLSIAEIELSVSTQPWNHIAIYFFQKIFHDVTNRLNTWLGQN